MKFLLHLARQCALSFGVLLAGVFLIFSWPFAKFRFAKYLSNKLLLLVMWCWEHLDDEDAHPGRR